MLATVQPRRGGCQGCQNKFSVKRTGEPRLPESTEGTSTVAIVSVMSAEGVTRRVELGRGTGVRVGRGDGRAVDIVASDDRSLSRHAVTVAVTPLGMIEVVSLQSTGSVRITRADGGVAAVLHRGERVQLQHAPLDVVVHTGAGPVAAVHVETPTPPAVLTVTADPQRTAPRWMLWDVQQPPPGREWLAVAALAAVLTRAARRRNPFAQPLRKQLESACQDWFDLPALSKGQLSTWLDQAMRAVNLQADGADKTGLLGDYVLSGGLLGTAELDILEAELAERRASRATA
jgi:hypothetical protein